VLQNGSESDKMRCIRLAPEYLCTDVLWNTITDGFGSSGIVNHDDCLAVPDVSTDRIISTFKGQEFKESVIIENEGPTVILNARNQ
jgi:hypothetical protein